MAAVDPFSLNFLESGSVDQSLCVSNFEGSPSLESKSVHGVQGVTRFQPTDFMDCLVEFATADQP